MHGNGMASLGRGCWDRAHAATVAGQMARMRRAGDPGLQERLIAACEEQWGGPRDLRLVTDFLRKTMTPGDWLLSGAGTHTADILPVLRDCPGVRLRGILDRAGSALGERFGLPVLPYEAALDHPGQPILISHQEFEPQMRRSLLCAGVTADRIHTIYGNPDYIRMSADGWRSLPVPERADAVIVSFGRSNWQVLSDETLASCLPVDRTVRLFGGKPIYFPKDSLFPVVDAHQSSSWIASTLKALSPKLIYLQTTFQICTARWLPLLRKACPGTPIVHEIYDWMATLPAYQVMGQFHYDEVELEDGLDAEAVSAMTADAIVHKCGGRWWKSLEAPFRKKAIHAFPVVAANAKACGPVLPQSRGGREPSSIRVLYAGSLPSESEIQRWAPELEIMGLARSITENADPGKPPIEIHIYNLVHRTPAQDINYPTYMARSGENNIHYHRSVEWAEMLKIMGTFDFGLCALDFPYEPPRFMDAVGLANKFPSYVFGGLPVIANRRDIYTAALVRRFKAGLLVEELDGAALAHRIQAADRETLWAGAGRLHAYMARFNSRSLDRLRAIIPSSLTTA